MKSPYQRSNRFISLQNSQEICCFVPHHRTRIAFQTDYEIVESRRRIEKCQEVQSFSPHQPTALFKSTLEVFCSNAGLSQCLSLTPPLSLAEIFTLTSKTYYPVPLHS